MGGVPTGGLRFGASHNAAAHMPCATMIDFYNGGGVDVACLGMAEVSDSCNQPFSGFCESACNQADRLSALLFKLTAAAAAAAYGHWTLCCHGVHTGHIPNLDIKNCLIKHHLGFSLLSTQAGDAELLSLIQRHAEVLWTTKH